MNTFSPEGEQIFQMHLCVLFFRIHTHILGCIVDVYLTYFCFDVLGRLFQVEYAIEAIKVCAVCLSTSARYCSSDQ